MSLLHNLFGGPHKRYMQVALAKLDAVDVLVGIFDTLYWDARAPLLRPHGPDCHCDPEGSVKIHVLRVLHNFCDRESNNLATKELLFSRQERALMARGLLGRRIVSGAAAVAAAGGAILGNGRARPGVFVASAAPSAAPVAVAALAVAPVAAEGEHSPPVAAEEAATATAVVVSSRDDEEESSSSHAHGLAWRVCAALVGFGTSVTEVASPHLTLRFWLCAAVEALVRGAPVELKMLLASWGVLRVCVGTILEESRRVPQPEAIVLQSYFDLLGELIKDNPIALGWISGADASALPDKVFAAMGPSLPEADFWSLCRVARSKLVEGNVFLRAVLLTVDRQFKQHPELLKPAKSWVETEGPEAARALWTIINLAETSQENLCCINTAIVFLTLARREGKLGSFVREMRATQPKSCVQLRSLLFYWRCYYSCRRMDRLSLQYSVGMPFAELKGTVDALCAAPRIGGRGRGDNDDDDDDADVDASLLKVGEDPVYIPLVTRDLLKKRVMMVGSSTPSAVFGAGSWQGSGFGGGLATASSSSSWRRSPPFRSGKAEVDAPSRMWALN